MTASKVAEQDSRPAVRRPGRRWTRRLNWRVYLVLLPTFAVLGVLAYYPSISGIWHSFYNWRPGYSSPFVGFANYRTMFADHQWWSSFRNLGVIFVASVTIMWVVPILASELVISLRSKRLQHLFRILLIVPLAFPGVVTALVWSFMYDPNDGVINRFLRAVGLGSWAHNWVGDPHTALGALLAIGFPWVAGLPFLVMLATLQNIPAEIFEAAALDGAGRLRRLVHIDLPLMAGQIKLLVFLAIVSTLHYGLAAYLVTSGGPDNSTQVPVLWIIGTAFQGQQWGYAAALSTTLFVITLGASALLMFGRRKERFSDVRTF